MNPLRPAFEDACKRFKLDPASHTLALPAGPARRAPLPVDLDLAFRLLPNVPSGARLEVVAKPSSGAKAAAGAAAAGAAAVARPSAPAAAATAEAAAAAAAAPAGGGEAAAAAEAAAGPSSAADAPGASADVPPPPPPPARGPLASLGVRFPVHVFHRRALEAQADAQEAAAKKAAAAAASAAAAAAAAAGPEAAATTGPAAAAAAAAGAASPAAQVAPGAQGEADEDDAFFQFTAEDWALSQRAAEKRRREREAGAHLTTQAQRDAAATRRAESYGPVPVRLHYPDGFIAQAEFAATDTLFSVWELAARLASAELAGVGVGGGGGAVVVAGGGSGGGGDKNKGKDDDSLPLYLYTAPPKAVVKDLSATLYQAGLVPAANLHVGSSAPSAQRAASSHGPPPASLRAEARALASDEVPALRPRRPRAGDGEGKGKAPAASAAAPLGPGRGGAMGLLAAGVGGGGGGAGDGAGGGGGGKPGVPKWLQARK